MQENVTGNQSAVKKVKRTISSMIARVTVNGCILLGVVALIMGLWFYSVSRGRQYITLACNTANQAAINVQHGADVVPVAQRVMEIYRGLSEEDRQKLGTDEYRDFFAEIQADPQYQHVINILGGYLEFSDVYDDYLIFGNNRTKVIEADGRSWRTKEPAVMYFYKNNWFNVIGQYKKDGIYYYCNIASPFLIEEDTIKYIDYDLDLRVFPDGSFKVLDRGEYKYHKELRNYSDKLDKVLKSELTFLIEMVRKKESPFAKGIVEHYYEIYKKLKKK